MSILLENFNGTPKNLLKNNNKNINNNKHISGAQLAFRIVLVKVFVSDTVSRR
jgi:hypothetical protein